MAIDRADRLRNAEKLLRQGKSDAAIAEYLLIVGDHPRDWSTANILGDLYVRAGKIDKAVDQFVRIAGGLGEDGFLPKAIALYKKVLKLKPDHEHALLQAGEIAASQGLLLDARTFLNALSDRRRARGDDRGLAEVIIRLGALDPADYPARLDAARARNLIQDTPGAVRDFKAVAEELAGKGRQAEAIEALREAAVLSPADDEIRERLLAVYLGAGDYTRARECASTVEQFKALAARLDELGQSGEALATLREAARLDPSDVELKAYLARTFVARGDFASAAEYLTVETAGDDPTLLLTVAEIQLRGGQLDEGVALVRRLLDEDASCRDDVAQLGWNIAEHAPEAGFIVVGLAAETAVAQSDWPAAAAAFQELVTRVPNHIPALMRLVEICVDGGLEATMYSAQAQLADAYIAAGLAAEARFIAEDLVAREPWERSNIERFRRTLVLIGEPDPDALIASRLSGETPFTSTDLSLGSDDLPPFEAPAAAVPISPPPVAAVPISPPPAPVTALKPADVPASPASAMKPEGKKKGRDQFELGTNAIDFQSLMDELESPPSARVRTESVEVDLSIVLDEIREPDLPAEAPVKPAGDLDDVFAQLRTEASRRTALEVADEEYQRGLALHREGKIDECIPALQAASRAPRLRFVTASLLGRIFRDRGLTPQAIESFERAAEAPAPTPEEGQELLYDLADALEKTGEVARALAICMELHAEVGEYRDISSRIDRLSKVQSRG
jgi:tetratricopeptide (TPR) repeat protein